MMDIETNYRGRKYSSDVGNVRHSDSFITGAMLCSATKSLCHVLIRVLYVAGSLHYNQEALVLPSPPFDIYIYIYFKNTEKMNNTENFKT